jgi:hypothetical protein
VLANEGPAAVVERVLCLLNDERHNVVPKDLISGDVGQRLAVAARSCAIQPGVGQRLQYGFLGARTGPSNTVSDRCGTSSLSSQR